MTQNRGRREAGAGNTPMIRRLRRLGIRATLRTHSCLLPVLDWFCCWRLVNVSRARPKEMDRT